jgi:L-amino acid N-acyltransferase YncA
MKMNEEIQIIKANESHYNAILEIWNEVILEGKSFFWKNPFDYNNLVNLLKRQTEVYVVVKDSNVIGFYILHPNFPDRGNHIANALYAIRKDFRNVGIGYRLGLHSLKVAKEHNFKGIQFNAVVSSNIASNKLWTKLGFRKIGEIPEAFKNADGYFESTNIYYKKL